MTVQNLAALVAPFVASVASGRTEIYNEFSLQHELGIYLRAALPERKVQFERNVSFFFQSKAPFTKKEIDVSVFSTTGPTLAYAIELKYPRNGQHPEQMFSFCKDVAFAEELCTAGFAAAGLVIFADDRLFYEGSSDGIYGFFRGRRPLHGAIRKPTGRKDEEIEIRGTYQIQWSPVVDSLRCAVIDVMPAGLPQN